MIGKPKTVDAGYLDLGKNYHTTIAAVVRFLIETVKVKKEDIGRVDLQNRAILVELTSQQALKNVLKNAPDKKFAGRKVRVSEKTKGRQSSR